MKRIGLVGAKIITALAAIVDSNGSIITLDGTSGISSSLKPIVRWYQNANRQERYRIRVALARLRREKLIDMVPSPDGKTRIMLTEKGHRKSQELRADAIKIPPMPRWDKIWRLVVFDIPESHKKGRDSLRRKLLRLNFTQIQRSIWAHPHECREQIYAIADAFGIANYVRIIEASRIDGEKSLRAHFGIRI